MRDRLIEALNESTYLTTTVSKPGLLVYLMGPYKSYPPYESVRPPSKVATDRPTLDEIVEQMQHDDIDTDAALALLLALRDRLRSERGVNAFLATDPQIDLHEMDAATQSIEYTKVAVGTVFIAPAMGDNLGVGIEVGSVCEHLPTSELVEKVLFTGEQNVESSMIDAVSDRWHVTVDSFDGYDDLYQTVKAHIRAIA